VVKRMMHLRDWPTHGTRFWHDVQGCRCEPCKEAAAHVHDPLNPREVRRAS